jgi:hypothetical protein
VKEKEEELLQIFSMSDKTFILEIFNDGDSYYYISANVADLL